MSDRSELLGLMAMLSMLGASRPDSSSVRRVSQEVGRLPDELISTLLASKPFEGLPDKGKNAVDTFNVLRDNIAKLDPADVGEVIVIISRKDARATPGEPCKGCGEVHDASITMLSSMIGDSLTLEMMWRAARAAGESRNGARAAGMNRIDIMDPDNAEIIAEMFGTSDRRG